MIWIINDLFYDYPLHWLKEFISWNNEDDWWERGESL